MSIKFVKYNKLKAIGLLETLIAILTVCFGLVGIAALQVKNTAYLNNSINSLKASFYAEDFAQRLSGNTVLARSVTSPYILPTFTNTPLVVATSAYCVTATCTPNELAIYDMNAWLYKIKNDFPNGQAKITQEINGNNAVYTIQIQWRYKADTKTYQFITQI